jgi:transcriptional regulator with XRE-family HTH domain
MANDTPRAVLGALVRKRREALHISMDELAMQAGVSRSTIHRIEHAHATRPMPAKLARVLNVIGVGPEELATVIDDDTYRGDIIHWLSRTEAVKNMGRTLRARPMFASLVNRPDFVVIDQETGEGIRVYGGGDKIATVLEAAGYLVTQPRASGDSGPAQ